MTYFERKSTEFDCHFATVESPRIMLQIFHRFFGWDSKPSRKQLPYGLPECEEHLYWKQHDLDIALVRTSEESYLIHAITSDRGSFKTLKLIRSYYEVDSRKVFREAYFRQVEKEYLDELDGRIRFGTTAIGFIAVLWLVLGFPNEIRFELLLVSGAIALIFEYGRMISSVDIRLMLWGSFWYFLYVAIPAGLLFGIGMTMSLLYSYASNPFEYTSFALLMLSLLAMMATFLVAISRGSLASRRLEGQQEYLSVNRVPGVLTVGHSYIQLESQSFLMFLALLSGIAFGIRLLWYLEGIYLLAAICSIFLFVPFLINTGRGLYKFVRGEAFRKQLIPMVRELWNYSEIVEKIAEKDARRKKHDI